MRRARGVTLIELMLVVVIIAILASIAVPSYRAYLLRSQRTDARTALLKIQSAQERFLLQQNRYALDDELTVAPPAGLGQLRVSDNGFYQIEIVEGATPTEYVLEATPVSDRGQQDDSKCAEFSIDQNGIKRAVNTSGTDTTQDCWR
jgi:type IV pilus assembly protein PilE